MRLQRRITTAGWRRTRYSSRRFVVGAKSGKQYSAATLSAFGEDLTHHCPPPPTFSTSSSFFTGKPAVAGLGHAFLMRNYRASLGKWQTADPMGYPDGWNALAYCNNGVTSAVDLWGCSEWKLVDEWNKPLSDDVWCEIGRDAPSEHEINQMLGKYRRNGWIRYIIDEGEEIVYGPTIASYKNKTDLIWCENVTTTYVYSRMDKLSVIVTTKELEDDPSCWESLGNLFLTCGSKIPEPVGKAVGDASDLKSVVDVLKELKGSIDQYGKVTEWTIDIGTVIYSKERQSSFGFLMVRE